MRVTPETGNAAVASRPAAALAWHSLTSEPVKYDDINSPGTQVSGIWHAILLPEGTTDPEADGPFIEMSAYVEGLVPDDDGNPTEYGVTLQIEYGIRENGDVSRAWNQYDGDRDVRCYDPDDDGKAAAFGSAKRVIADHIANANKYFSWDGESEPAF